MILVIDNYDSFVHNLARYFRLLGCATQVVRNDEISIDALKKIAPAAIVLSPGPCSPDQAGVSLEVVRSCYKQIPILGICLGHQTIVQAMGGKIVTAEEPMHGRSSPVNHNASAMFKRIANPFAAGRYHSLVGQNTTLPDNLRATAFTADQTIMAIEHTSRPVFGLQFHPESVLTDCGFRLISNFLSAATLEHHADRVDELQSNQLQGSSIGIRPYPISTRLTKRPKES